MAAQGGRKYICCALLLMAVLPIRSAGINVVTAGDEKESSSVEGTGKDGLSYEKPKKPSSASEQTSATTVSGRGAEDVTDDCLKYVNFFRRDQTSNPLPGLLPHKPLENYVTSRMAEVAQKNCSTMEFYIPPGVGATFYGTSGKDPSCKKAAYSWYRQIHSLHGMYPGTKWDKNSVGQFSQMMWDSSRLMACARTTNCTAGFHQLACLYYPAGNILGEAPFSEEVWHGFIERHANWTSEKLAQSTRTTTTTAAPLDPPIPYLLKSLEEALQGDENVERSQ